jgi:hypothetical protein
MVVLSQSVGIITKQKGPGKTGAFDVLENADNNQRE